MKTVCVLTLGWLLFDSELTFKNLMGMALAVIGMIVYSWAVEAEKQTKTTLPSSLSEEDLKPLKEGIAEIPLKDSTHGEAKV